jgi:hypothetical protein
MRRTHEAIKPGHKERVAVRFKVWLQDEAAVGPESSRSLEIDAEPGRSISRAH